MPGGPVQEALNLAVRHHQAGRLAEAEELYHQVLAAHPNHPDALHLLGVIALQSGRHELAAEFLRRAIGIKPNFAPPHYHLGNVLREQRKLSDAIAEYRHAIQLKPDYAEAHANLGLALTESGLHEEAIAAYRQALEFKPGQAEIHNNLAGALKDQGRFHEAITAYRRALERKPDFAAAHFNLGNLFRGQGRLDEAISSYSRAIELHPSHAEGHHNLGVALEERGRLNEAISAYRRALTLRPDYAEAHNNLGIALTLSGQTEVAIAAYRRAIELQPDYAEACNNLGVALKERDRLDEAIDAHRRAIQLKPDLVGAHNNLAVALKDRGDVDEAIATFRQALTLDPQQPSVHSNLIFALYYQPNQNQQTVAEEQERWNTRFCAPFRHLVQPHTNNRDPDRRLKIGYVSAGFRDDAIGANLWPLIKSHDHRNFEILCYSGVVQPDRLTAEFRHHADQWRSTVGVGDDALAAMIHEDGVDVLVDLSQHISGTRLPVFARRPAPVQVSFLGYPDSAGIDAIPYRISDRWLELERQMQVACCRSQDGSAPLSHLASCDLDPASGICLIDTFWCHDPRGIDVAVNALPAAEAGRVTFGSLNNFCKFNEPMWRLWARLLHAVPDSRLLILAGAGSHRDRTREILQREGIDPERVEFFSRRPRREYMELYHRVDIALDPFPYNGHTTSLEALWMGVPVVSLAGETRVSRGGLSILNNLGLSELVATTADEYFRIAAELASDLPRLAALRATLRSRMESSVLMDAPHFASQVEAAYRAMWWAWCGRTN
jgi:predicted O-linked N-acetylglucosamine transferase (SPINDLY family)